jgi:hypothetical protein
MADQNDPFPTREPLPPELEPLHRRLLDDGALWRARLPSTERLEQRLKSLTQQERYMRLMVPAENRPGRLSLIDRVKGKQDMLRGRFKTALAVVTIAAVVALFAVLFYGFAGHMLRTTAQPTSTATHPTSEATNFPTGHYGEEVPIVAPSDPEVVYKLVPANGSADQQMLARSTDGGATWQMLAVPSVGTSSGVQAAFVSPLNPQAVFLTVGVQLSGTTPGAQPCPPDLASGSFNSYVALAGDYSYCDVEFLSTDGGRQWSRVHLPADAVPAALGDSSGNLFYPYNSGYGILFSTSATVFHVQGNRLYSVTDVDASDGLSGGSGAIRIVVSTDGGLNWSYADEALASSVQSICDYAATPSGATVFAITSDPCSAGRPISLWRSDDAGAHWAKVRQLSGWAEAGMIAVSRDNGQTPLLYINMAQAKVDNQTVSLNLSPANVVVSADGGETWAPAPIQGFPTTQPGNTPGYAGPPLGILSDGSVLFRARTGQAIDSFYAWKLGDASWQQVGPNFNTVVAAFVVSGANNTICAITSAQSVYSVHTFNT